MNHAPIVRHPDLSRMSMEQLYKELRYSIQQAYLTWNHITEQFTDLSDPDPINIGMLKVPIWKYTEDLTAHTDRIQAISEEIQFRRIP